MIIFDNKYKTKEIKIKPEPNLNHNIHVLVTLFGSFIFKFDTPIVRLFPQLYFVSNYIDASQFEWTDYLCLGASL